MLIFQRQENVQEAVVWRSWESTWRSRNIASLEHAVDVYKQVHRRTDQTPEVNHDRRGMTLST